jgi:calcineurin-like phosphoesterase family protein
MGTIPNVNSLKCREEIGGNTVFVLIGCHLGEAGSDSADLAYWMWGSDPRALAETIIGQFWFSCPLSLKKELSRLIRPYDEVPYLKRAIAILTAGPLLGGNGFSAEVYSRDQALELLNRHGSKPGEGEPSPAFALDCEGDPSIDVRELNHRRFCKKDIAEKRLLDAKPRWKKWYCEDDCPQAPSIGGGCFRVGIKSDPARQKAFGTFEEFAEFLDFDLAGANLWGYRFSDFDVDFIGFEKCDFSNVFLDKEAAFSACAFPDFLFYEGHRKIAEKGLALSGEDRKYPIQIKASPIQLINEDRVDGLGGIFYISDLHLDYKIAADFPGRASKKQIGDYINEIAEKINENVDEKSLLLIGGDTTFDPNIFEMFFWDLRCHVLTVLGNHELWSFSDSEAGRKTCDEIINKFRSTGAVIENELVIFRYASFWYSTRYSQDDILKMPNKVLKEKGKDAFLIVLGGVGFSGLNERFNASNGIYRDTIGREEEIERSEAFENLYRRANSAFGDKKVIVLTHMPMRDWTSDKPNPKWVYISGHTHKNYAEKAEEGTFLADHQVGYEGRDYLPGYFPLEMEIDHFADYKDGKYGITLDDYLKFYRCHGVFLGMKRDRFDITMLKRDGFYLFLGREKSAADNCLFILSGGRASKTKKSLTTEYFFDNMAVYGKAIKAFIKKYSDFQRQVALAVKGFGGDGKIHGAIVDIDYYDHVYVNPLDMKLTPYFALNMVDKLVYPDVGSLLFAQSKELYRNFIGQSNAESVLLLGMPHGISKRIRPKKVFDTSMYKASRILKSLQYTSGFNVVRTWNETLLDAAKKNPAFQGEIVLEFIREGIEKNKPTD